MLYCIISSVLFGVSLLFPEFAILGIGTFIVPLFFEQQTAKNGAVWGMITFTIYWWWLLILLTKYSNGILVWIVFAVLIAWCMTVSSLWFYFFNRYPLCSSVLFFIFVIKYSMIIFVLYEGMPLYNPLMLLAQYPLILQPLPYIGDLGMLIILLGVQIWIASQLPRNNKKVLVVYLIAVSCLQVMSSYWPQEHHKEIENTAIIIPWWYKKGDGMFCGYRLSHDISKIVQKKTSQIILTPESTFCFDLQEYQEFIPIWCESANNIPILLATHLFKDGVAHNCALLLHNNEILSCYIKEHAMPLLEKNIWLEHLTDTPLLSSDLIDYHQHQTLQNDLLIIDRQIYQLFICSEFFFEAKPVLGYPIILLWNDTWLTCPYAQKLALLFIKYFEKKYGLIVYHIATSGLSNLRN